MIRAAIIRPARIPTDPAPQHLPAPGRTERGAERGLGAGWKRGGQGPKAVLPACASPAATLGIALIWRWGDQREGDWPLVGGCSGCSISGCSILSAWLRKSAISCSVVLRKLPRYC